MELMAEQGSFEAVLEGLVADAVSRDVPADIALEAKVATLRAIRDRPARPATLVRRRAEAYFSAVVRRRVVRSARSAKASARLVLASVVEDLRDAGRNGAEIWDELQLGWAQSFPRDVLEEYRLALCR